MAPQAPDRLLHDRIERCLDYQWNQWRDISWWAESWPAMEALDREVFHLEWMGITEGWLARLQGWADGGLLTPEQRRRFAQLTQLVAEQRPTLRALLEEQ